MIIRGTDSDIKITFSTVDPQAIAAAYLTIDQNGQTILEKNLAVRSMYNNLIDIYNNGV